MKEGSVSNFADKTAIVLSSLCVLHCIASPLLLLLVPLIAGVAFITDESIHLGLLALVVPISLSTLLIIVKQHRGRRVLSFIGAGALCLVVQ